MKARHSLFCDDLRALNFLLLHKSDLVIFHVMSLTCYLVNVDLTLLLDTFIAMCACVCVFKLVTTVKLVFIDVDFQVVPWKSCSPIWFICSSVDC